MPLQSMPWWLRSEAIAVYVTLLFTSLMWLIGLRLARKRPSIIRVRKEFQSELIDIDPSVKERLRILYDDDPIQELHQAIFTVHNTGDQSIRNIDIHFFFDGFEEKDFLEAVLTNAEETQVVKLQPLGPEFESFNIHLPFLNPYKRHEDYVGITLYAPKPLTVKAVTGRGCGWSTKYVDKAEYIDRVARVLVEGATPMGSFTARMVDVLVNVGLLGRSP